MIDYQLPAEIKIGSVPLIIANTIGQLRRLRRIFQSLNVCSTFIFFLPLYLQFEVITQTIYGGVSGWLDGSKRIKGLVQRFTLYQTESGYGTTHIFARTPFFCRS